METTRSHSQLLRAEIYPVSLKKQKGNLFYASSPERDALGWDPSQSSMKFAEAAFDGMDQRPRNLSQTDHFSGFISHSQYIANPAKFSPDFPASPAAQPDKAEDKFSTPGS